MTNYEKVKLIAEHLQGFIDDGFITEERCDSVLDELIAVFEVVADYNEEQASAFSQELYALEIAKIEYKLAEAYRKNNLREMKMAMQYLEEFKAKHPRPKHKKEGDEQ